VASDFSDLTSLSVAGDLLAPKGGCHALQYSR
jgi:hypothetical protein